MDENSRLLLDGNGEINGEVCKQPGMNKVWIDSTVNCQVCNAVISIGHKDKHLVVKCLSCNETTPIKGPPPGKQFVRCVCNCLLICKSSTIRVVCPRPHCRHVTILAATTAEYPIQSTRERSQTDGGTFTSSRIRLTCGSCHRPFSIPSPSTSYSNRRSFGDKLIYFLSRGSAENSSLLISARCPQCQRLTSVGPAFARVRWTAYLTIIMIFLLLSISVTGGTINAAVHNHAFYFLWSILYIVLLICFIRFLIFFRMPISAIEVSVSNSFPPTLV